MRNLWVAVAAVLIGGFVVGLSNQIGATADPIGSTQKPVLELFTSQGCSSCPPADALLRRYIERGDVIALSVAVDYWDRLGWKDSFASSENSDRQRSYARGRGDGEVYTPQMVINGRAHAVGSRAGDIDNALKQTNNDYKAAQVAISAKFDGENFVVHLGKTKPGRTTDPAKAMLAVVQEHGLVNIKRGENSGRQVGYHNIVRKFKQIGSWNGQGKTLRIPRTALQTSCCKSIVVLLQESKSGSILSAAQVQIP